MCVLLAVGLTNIDEPYWVNGYWCERERDFDDVFVEMKGENYFPFLYIFFFLYFSFLLLSGSMFCLVVWIFVSTNRLVTIATEGEYFFFICHVVCYRYEFGVFWFFVFFWGMENCL